MTDEQPGIQLGDGKVYVRVRDVQKLFPKHPILKAVCKHMFADPAKPTRYDPVTDDPDLLLFCYSR